MPKNKQQKKKDRERRVSQEKLAAAKSRAQLQKNEAVQKTAGKTHKLTASLAPPKVDVPRVKQTFTRPRSVG